jgi:hypothetical protein
MSGERPGCWSTAKLPHILWWFNLYRIILQLRVGNTSLKIRMFKRTIVIMLGRLFKGSDGIALERSLA